MVTDRQIEHSQYLANEILKLRKSKEKALDQINQVIQKCNQLEDGLEKTKRLEMAELVKAILNNK